MDLALALQKVQSLSEEERESLTSLIASSTHSLWSPNPGPQSQAYYSEADELFYGGAAGGGKSALIIGLALTKHQRSLILRRESTQLRGMIDDIARTIRTRSSVASSKRRSLGATAAMKRRTSRTTLRTPTWCTE